jgi:hypothetical protein
MSEPEKKEKKRSLPIFNPAIPALIILVIVAVLGVLMSNFDKVFSAFL